MTASLYPGIGSLGSRMGGSGQQLETRGAWNDRLNELLIIANLRKLNVPRGFSENTKLLNGSRTKGLDAGLFWARRRL
jgi:hypothetical protein